MNRNPPLTSPRPPVHSVGSDFLRTLSMPQSLQLLKKSLPAVLAWIDSTLAAHRAAARPVSSFGFARLAAYYPAALLASTQAIPIARVPAPPLSRLGLTGFDEFENLPAAGITYRHSFFVLHGHERDESLHFHELVHVVQWQHLGPENFVMAYALGHLRNGYRQNPLEVMAYDSQARFESHAPPFDVPAFVRLECDRVVPELFRHLHG